MGELRAINQLSVCLIRGKIKKLKINCLFIVFFGFMLVVAGCDKKSEKLIVVENKMITLQDEYNSGEYELIYNQASVSFK
ncbi:hypothetical protein [Rahnella ecdela]|uniref:Uncharacterized protein n=1 Tax=Rahnella ecdela TaxID=2816250 RepID=A0ABS6LAZ1_9GAMM|nr:hypothetical protein [Rahnella ecdela]MBU9844106.1 hypothetical protein [Rahnella ecdela]